MGVRSHLDTRDAPEHDRSETTTERDQPVGNLDPFSLEYRTDLYSVDSETFDQALSMVIALSNLL